MNGKPNSQLLPRELEAKLFVVSANVIVGSV